MRVWTWVLPALLAAGCGGAKPAETKEEPAAADGQGLGERAAAELKKAAEVTGDKITEVVHDVGEGGEKTAAEVQRVAVEAAGELEKAGRKVAGETKRIAQEVEANTVQLIEGKRPEPAAATQPAPGAVDGARARALVAGGARLVDVRTPEEFAAGHVEGALNIPVDALAGRLGELPDPAAPLVLYCGSGRRSARAAALLAEKGYTAVYDLGGMSNW